MRNGWPAQRLSSVAALSADCRRADLRPDYSKQQAAKQSVGWMMPPGEGAGQSIVRFCEVFHTRLEKMGAKWGASRGSHAPYYRFGRGHMGFGRYNNCCLNQNYSRYCPDQDRSACA